MSSELEKTFGFELLFNIFKVEVTKKEDVLIIFVHWCFVKNWFKCLGIGDSKTLDASEKGSELLPEGWNQASNYTLRYVKGGKLYILMGVRSETDLLLNLLRIEDHSVSNVQFSLDNVKELQGSLEVLIPNYETLMNILKKDLVEPLCSERGHEIATQTSHSHSDISRRDTDNDPLRVGPPRGPVSPIMPGIPRADPFGIGRDDLDPLGQGRRGMIFDPFAYPGSRPPFPGLGIPGRLPHGAVPPGARFDPFGPPDNNPPLPRIGDPDNDHLPPPGYDDMFM